MGRMIDDSIKYFTNMRKTYIADTEQLSVAIETMRKYQKIEELAEYHMIRFLPKERMSGFQKDILEVLEDGSTN